MKKLFVVLILLICAVATASCAQTNIEDLIALPATGTPEQRILNKLAEVEADEVSESDKLF